MVSGIILYKSKTVEETLFVRITRDFDPSKTCSIFLDRDWFSRNTIFVSEYGIQLTLTGKFKRISESETVYTVDNKRLPNIILQAGHRLEYVGMSVLNEEPIEYTDSLATDLYNNWMANNKPKTTCTAEFDLLSEHERKELTVFDNTRSGRIQQHFSFPEIENLPEPKNKVVEPEPLYSEEDLVPSQFFGLNDYLKCEI